MNGKMRSTASPPNEKSVKLFNDLVLRNKAMIWHVCNNYNLGMVWKPEDRMQEVLINLWRDFDKFEGRSSEKTWVYRVATNTMLMLRRKSNMTPVTETLEQEENTDTAAEGVNDDYQQLLQLIDALPEKDGITIRAFLDGFSYKEIADMTGSTVGAVAMRIARTKRRLKKMYDHENQANTITPY